MISEGIWWCGTSPCGGYGAPPGLEGLLDTKLVALRILHDDPVLTALL